LDECCEIILPVRIRNKDLREAYTIFYELTGFDVRHQKKFIAYLKKTEGARWKNTPTGIIWEGIDILEDEEGVMGPFRHIRRRVMR